MCLFLYYSNTQKIVAMQLYDWIVDSKLHSFSSGIAKNMDRASCGEIKQVVCISVTQGCIYLLPG